jgi:hypothetical protein
MIWLWWLDRVFPGLTGGGVLGVAGYASLWFEKKWPYWGRTREDKK